VPPRRKEGSKDRTPKSQDVPPQPAYPRLRHGDPPVETQTGDDPPQHVLGPDTPKDKGDDERGQDRSIEKGPDHVDELDDGRNRDPSESDGEGHAEASPQEREAPRHPHLLPGSRPMGRKKPRHLEVPKGRRTDRVESTVEARHGRRQQGRQKETPQARRE